MDDDQHRDDLARGPASRAKRRIWIAVGIALAALLLVLVIHRRNQAAERAAAETTHAQILTLRTAAARLGDMPVFIDALGTVTPLATVNVYSQVTGRVTAVHYVEGQSVRRGAPLIDIDPRPYQAQLAEAQGTLRHDRGLLAQAMMDVARYRAASDTQAISRQQYEDQVQLVEQYHGTVENDEGQVQYARVQLGYCHLTSPVDGRVGLRLVDAGNTVFSGSSNALVVITQIQPISVVFDVAEDEIDRVRGELSHPVPLPVEVFDRAQLGMIATGHLLTLDNQIDTSTGTVRFRAQFDNGDRKLFPNQFVNTRLRMKTLSNAVLVPTAAIQRNGTQAYVYLVARGHAALRSVTVLASEGADTAVTGLRSGDQIAVTGFNNLEDGLAVRIAPAPAARSAAAPTMRAG